MTSDSTASTANWEQTFTSALTTKTKREIVKMLVPERLTPEIWQPVMVAGRTDIVTYLLDQGMDPARADDGTTAMHLAVSQEMGIPLQSILRVLVKAGADLDQRDANGRTVLDRFCENPISDDLPTVVTFLRRNSRLPASAYTLVRLGDTAELYPLLSQAPFITSLDIPCPFTGLTLLQCAARCGRTEIVTELLRRGASPTALSNPDGIRTIIPCTPLFFATEGARPGRTAIVEQLLKAGAEVNALSEFHWSALHAAALYNHVASVRVLLDAGADPSLRDIFFHRPLDLAIESGNTAVIAILQSEDDLLDRLSLACWDGRIPAVRELVTEHPELVHRRDAHGGATPLVVASFRGHYPIVSALLATGADPNLAEDDTGRTPLHAACDARHPLVAELLIASGADIDHTDLAFGWTPLTQTLLDAENPDNKEAIVSLLRAGSAREDLFSALATFSETPDRLRQLGSETPRGVWTGWRTGGVTPLQLAISRGQYDAVAELLEAGVDGQELALDGRSAYCIAQEVSEEADTNEAAGILEQHGVVPDLSIALRVHDWTLARILLTAQPERLHRDQSYARLLHRAVAWKDPAVAELLLRHGADPEIRETHLFGSLPMHMTALHAAILNHDAEMVATLVEYGADINAIAYSPINLSPLMLAVIEKNAAVAENLLVAKPDLEVRDNNMRLTALGWAISSRCKPLIRLLQEYGAQE